MNQAQWNKAEFNESLVQLGVMRRGWYAMVYIMQLSPSQSDSKMSCMHTQQGLGQLSPTNTLIQR